MASNAAAIAGRQRSFPSPKKEMRILAPKTKKTSMVRRLPSVSLFGLRAGHILYGGGQGGGGRGDGGGGGGVDMTVCMGRCDTDTGGVSVGGFRFAKVCPWSKPWSPSPFSARQTKRLTKVLPPSGLSGGVGTGGGGRTHRWGNQSRIEAPVSR